jgi:integrase
VANHSGLTDIAIKNLAKPKQGQAELWDGRIPGFGMRVSHTGTKAFVLVYRFNGRPRRLTLGRYPSLNLKDARGLAQEGLRSLAHGEDPAAEKARARRLRPAEGFEGFVGEFVEMYARPKNRSAGETERLLRREFVSAWGNRPIGEIGKHDVIAVLDRLMRAKKHATANGALAAVRKLFNWAVERGMLEQSPCMGIRAPAKPVKRDRVLTDAELAIVWACAERMDYPYSHLVRLLIVTAQRLREVAGMRWADVSGEAEGGKAVWSLSAKHTKAERAHAVPLSSSAMRIIASIPRLSDELVFPARGREHMISGFSKWKAVLDEAAGIADWRLHDLRRTAATGMARLAVEPHIIERVLNHASGTLGGVAGIYNRFHYLPAMGDALELWAKHVEGLVNPTLRPEASRPVATSQQAAALDAT